MILPAVGGSVRRDFAGPREHHQVTQRGIHVHFQVNITFLPVLASRLHKNGRFVGEKIRICCCPNLFPVQGLSCSFRATSTDRPDRARAHVVSSNATRLSTGTAPNSKSRWSNFGAGVAHCCWSCLVRPAEEEGARFLHQQNGLGGNVLQITHMSPAPPSPPPEAPLPNKIARTI